MPLFKIIIEIKASSSLTKIMLMYSTEVIGEKKKQLNELRNDY